MMPSRTGTAYDDVVLLDNQQPWRMAQAAHAAGLPEGSDPMGGPPLREDLEWQQHLGSLTS